MLFNKTTLSVIIMLALYLIARGAVCASAASNATSISVNVTANCHVNNAVMNFGEYDPVSKNAQAPLMSITSFEIACTKGASASISMSAGNNASHASGTSRAMSTGGASTDFISYELYTNAGFATVWNTSNVIQYVANNSRKNTVKVFGKIPAGQDVSAGYYTDVVNIVANF